MGTKTRNVSVDGVRWALMKKFEIPFKDGKIYLRRWRILQTPAFAIYLHTMYTGDSTPIPHNHPWTFRSFILKGGYTERFQRDATSSIRERHWGWLSWHRMGINAYHSIRCLDATPTWSLLFVGRRVQSWGFLADGKFIPYADFDASLHDEEW
jgi:hypothetical protein